MKKLISLVLCVVLLLGCVTIAQAETTQETSNAVDIVLLIDQSGSLHSVDTPSDKEGYRQDAAEMAIALLSKDNGSRVAYVPFAARVYEEADSSFYTISSAEDYRKKMRECEEHRVYKHHEENSGGTDFAQALAYAYNLLASRGPNETNQPMIILLTDGGLTIELNNGAQKYVEKDYYEWNDQTGLFQQTYNNRVALNRDVPVNRIDYYAEELLEDAIVRCREKGYPIYTVALYERSKRDGDAHFALLDQIAQRTGAGSAVKVEDEESLKELPKYFGDIFADRIGSSEVRELHPVYDPATGEYVVEFVIPNDSVMEANLFVPKAGIQRYYLVDGEGGTPSTNSVTELDVAKYFVMYKLNNPYPYGIWSLRFTVDPTYEGNPTDISFNMLYNYDVVLHGDVQKTNSYESADIFQRGDVLKFSGRFWDNRSGGYSADSRLYQYPDNTASTVDDWCQMNATYRLYQRVGNGEVLVKEGPLDVELNPLQFAVELDMKTVKTSEGFNVLPAGDYYMALHVEGCGMERDATIDFTLVNTAPSQGVGPITLSREVDTNDPATHEITPIDVYVGDRIKDDDNDKIVSSFVPGEGVGDVIYLEYNPDTRNFTSTPITGEDGKLKYGTAKGELLVWEAPNGTPTRIPVTMKVSSGNDRLYGAWTLDISMNGEPSGCVLPKNSPVEVVMKLRRTDTGIIEYTDQADQIGANIEIVNVANGSLVASGPMIMGADKSFTFAHETGANSGEWKVTITTFQSGNEDLIVRTEEATFGVENKAPTANIVSEQHVIYHNPLPEFLSFLGEATTEEERTLDLMDYFSEMDNETLVYALTPSGAPNVNLLDIAMKDNIWVLNAVEGAHGKTQFQIFARDNDNAVTDAITFEVELIDLVKTWTERGLLALAVLVALIILILIICQAIKPKFPRVTLGVREGNSDYDTNSFELVPSKKPISLAAIVMPDTAAKFGISANALTSIELVPVRTVNGSIGVRIRKKLDGVSAGLTTQAVGKGKKPTIWAPGDVLTLNSASNVTGTELNVVLFPPDAEPGPGPMPGPDPFADPFQDNGVGGFNSDVNAFGANDVSGSYGGLAPSDNFSATVPASDSNFGVASGEDNSAGEIFIASNDSNDDFTIGF